MPATVPGRGPFCLSFAIRPYGTRYADEIVAKAVGRKFRAQKVGRAASFGSTKPSEINDFLPFAAASRASTHPDRARRCRSLAVRMLENSAPTYRQAIANQRLPEREVEALRLPPQCGDIARLG